MTNKTLALLLATLCLVVCAAQTRASVVGLSNSDFEADGIANGTFQQGVADWSESSTASDFNDWLYRDSTSFVDDNAKAGFSTTSGFLYQQIGTYTPGEIVNVSGEAHRRVVGNFRGFTVSLYSGDVSPGADPTSSLATLGATLLDSEMFTAADLGLTGSGTAAVANFASVLDAGFSGTTGEALWLEFTPGGVQNETFLDDLSVNAQAVPEPTSFALWTCVCALGVGYALRRRRVVP